MSWMVGSLNHHHLTHYNTEAFLAALTRGYFENYPVTEHFWELAVALCKIYGPSPPN